MGIQNLLRQKGGIWDTACMYYPSKFDIRLARELGSLVMNAYDQFSCLEGGHVWSLPQGYELVRALEYSGNPWRRGEKDPDVGEAAEAGRATGKKPEITPIGFIAKGRKGVFVIFRGTKTAKEWLSNLNAKFRDFPVPGQGRVHEGFLSAYEKVRKTIADTLKDLRGRPKLFVSGHSLGAGIATLAALDIELSMNREVAACYTFASPRVGDDPFAKAFNARFCGGKRHKAFRIANSSDLVTSIPLPIPIAGVVGGHFSHVDTPVEFNVQLDDVELNHRMAVYLDVIRSEIGRRGFLRGFFGRRPD